MTDCNACPTNNNVDNVHIVDINQQVQTKKSMIAGFPTTIIRESDIVVCRILQNDKSVDSEILHKNYHLDIEFIPTKTFTTQFPSQSTFTQQFIIYPDAHTLFKKYHPEFSMCHRFKSPLWKQAIDVLIQYNWCIEAVIKAANLLNKTIDDAIL